MEYHPLSLNKYDYFIDHVNYFIDRDRNLNSEIFVTKTKDYKAFNPSLIRSVNELQQLK